MVQTNNSRCFPQHSSWLPKLSCMSTSLEPRQPECLPVCISPNARMSMPRSLVPGTNPGSHVLPANTAVPGSADMSVLKTEQNYRSHELLQQQLYPCFPNSSADMSVLKAEQNYRSLELLQQQLYPCFPNSSPSQGSYLNEQQFMIAKGQYGDSANMVSGSLPKGLVIFDQSGGQTRLIYSSVHPPSQHATTADTELASCLDLHESEAIKTNLFTSALPTLLEEYDENHLNVEESDMREDTEELNALLYSDEEDDDYHNDNDEDYEVMSTDHSPIGLKRNYQSQDHVDDTVEEVASSDGPNKRQKLLNVGHKQSPTVDAVHSLKLKCSLDYDTDAESSYATGQNQGEEADFILRKKQSKKDKIHSTLKILESIIPGAKGKNPFVVLDESIDYLKSLKLEVKALGY